MHKAIIIVIIIIIILNVYCYSSYNYFCFCIFTEYLLNFIFCIDGLYFVSVTIVLLLLIPLHELILHPLCRKLLPTLKSHHKININDNTIIIICFMSVEHLCLILAMVTKLIHNENT